MIFLVKSIATKDAKLNKWSCGTAIKIAKDQDKCQANNSILKALKNICIEIQSKIISLFL